MFSEYASRFLAQSQSRLLASQTEPNQRRNPLERNRDNNSRASSRGFLTRQPLSNPYQSSNPQGQRFSFASRYSTPAPQAPLFHSTADDFREEDDIEEHEREVADFYALQRSRRDFGGSKLTESSESGGELEEGESLNRDLSRPRGIRSSWTGNDTSVGNDTDATKDTGKRKSLLDSVTSSIAGRRKSRLVDVDLGSTIHEDEDLVEQEPYEDPPSVQNFPRQNRSKPLYHQDSFMPKETDIEAARAHLRPPSPGTESIMPNLDVSPLQPPRHDTFWGNLFVISVVTLFASYILVCLHTTAPKGGTKLGDTVYSTMHSSFHLLAVDTLVAIVVALVWLATLRSFVRPLVYTILLAVPIISISFFLYPFISSFKGTWHGDSFQDKVMRWFAVFPAIFAVIWTYTAWRGRHSLGRAIQLLEFSAKILASSPALVIVGFGTLAAVVTWSWLWMLMFTRVFLEGHFNATHTRFLIDASTWWLATFYVLTYLWTLGVISGIQRTTTAATVSQWYFHRLVVPAPSSHRVVRASLDHALTTIFGTIALSSLFSLAIRLPLLVLPKRLAAYLSMAFYSFIPTSIATLTNPLTLTYAAIHSQPLSFAARGLSEMSFISSTSPTTTLTPSLASASSPSNDAPIFAYRLAKLLLHATRFVVALAFGFGGWVSTARLLSLEGAGYRGSLYAYVVGLIAGAIGWAVLGAMEGVLGGILDGVIVCWGSEMGRDGVARYCAEAGELLGGRGEVGL